MRKANTPGYQARSGQSCWNLQHASTHDQRGSTESTWHGKLHGQVVPNLTVKTTALRQLLPEKNDSQWEAEQAKEWQDIKDFFTTEPLLKVYDPDRRSKISSDASKDGLGAVLLQEHDGNWLPVAFISRAMTSAEKNYAQIEKELLGLVFACEKFHEYVYGAYGNRRHRPQALGFTPQEESVYNE